MGYKIVCSVMIVANAMFVRGGINLVETKTLTENQKMLLDSANVPYSYILNNLGRLDQLKFLFGHVPLLEVEGCYRVEQVPFNDNLSNLEVQLEDTKMHIKSLGLFRLEQGQMVEIKTDGTYPSAEIISFEEALRLIFKFGKYDLLRHFDFEGFAFKMLSD